MKQQRKTLDEIGLYWRTDKASNGHGYLKVYEEILPRNIHKMLEVGVLRGSSAMTWKEWFGCEIHLVDIFQDPDSVTPAWCKSKGFIPYVGDQSDEEFLSTKILDMFPLIIEDGSHRAHHQIITFKNLFFNNLERGGLYIVEDADICCREEFYRGGLAQTYEQTIMGMFLGYDKTRKIKNPYFSAKEAKILEGMIDRIHFDCNDNLIFIWKKA